MHQHFVSITLTNRPNYLRASYAGEAGIVFGGVCLSVRLSAQNLENDWSEVNVT